MKTKILIVDDSETICLTAAMFLKDANVEIRTAGDGYEGLCASAEFDPDIVFLDVMMPRISGYEVCSILRASPRMKDVGVVLLSSRDSLFDLARGRLGGVDSHLLKPFTRDGLLNAINTFSRKNKGDAHVKKSAYRG